jgi:hypothetical protein
LSSVCGHIENKLNDLNKVHQKHCRKYKLQNHIDEADPKTILLLTSNKKSMQIILKNS